MSEWSSLTEKETPMKRISLDSLRIFAQISAALAGVSYMTSQWAFSVLIKKILTEASLVFSSTNNHEAVSPILAQEASSDLFRAILMDNLSFDQVFFGIAMGLLPILTIAIVASRSIPIYLAARESDQIRMSIIHTAFMGNYVQPQNSIEKIVEGKESDDSDDIELSLGDSDSTDQRHHVVQLVTQQLHVVEKYIAEHKYVHVDHLARFLFAIVAIGVFYWQLLVLALPVFILMTLGDTWIERAWLRSARESWKFKSREVSHWVLDLIRTSDVIALNNRVEKEESELRNRQDEALAFAKHFTKFTLLFRINHHLLLSLIPLIVLYFAKSQLPLLAQGSQAIDSAFGLLVTFLMMTEVHKSLLSMAYSAEMKKESDHALQGIQYWLEGTQSLSKEDVPASEEKLQAHLAAGDSASSDAARQSSDFQVGSIVLKHVVLSYNSRSARVLDNFCFDVSRGTTVGIVGGSGIGKSSLCKVISGMIIPSKGTITLGNFTTGDESQLRTIRDHMCVVSQDTLLFRRTLRENIVYGCSEGVAIPTDRIVGYLEELNLKPWLAELPEGLDTVLKGERELSGGQRQLVELARLFCRLDHSQIEYVILDECVAALDPRSRKVVIGLLQKKLAGKTVLIVTHNYEILQIVDETWEFTKGGKMVLLDESPDCVAGGNN